MSEELENTQQTEEQETPTTGDNTPVAEDTSGASTSVINQVVEAVMDLIDDLNLFATTTRGALTTGPSISVEVGPSSPEVVFMDKNCYLPLDITINAKHENLQTLTEAMNTIHSSLTRMTSYPEDTPTDPTDSTYDSRWEIVDIVTGTLPQVIGREENDEWMMASSLYVKFYWKGD